METKECSGLKGRAPEQRHGLPHIQVMAAPVAVSRPTKKSSLMLAASPPPASLHVFLERWLFYLCWWLVLGFHLLLGSFALSVTALNRYLQDDRVALATSALRIPTSSLRMTARSFFLVGFAHFIAILRLVHRSVKARQLVFSAPPPEVVAAPLPTHPRSVREWLSSGYDLLSSAWDSLFSSTGIFGFSSSNFETLFVLREGLEILMQTYQAYQISRSVATQSINQLAVAAIVLNCVGSPLVHVLCPKNTNLRRILNVLQDACLDFCCSVVIPFCILMPYTRDFDSVTKSFPLELYMDDSWFVGAVAEVRQVLVTSMLDFVSTLMPQISLLGHLMTIKNVLRRRGNAVQAVSLVLVHVNKSGAVIAPVPSFNQAASTWASLIPLTERTKRPAQNRSSLVRSWRVIAHAMFLVCGAAVLGLHLDAAHNTAHNVPGCQLHVGAWLSSGFPCSVMLLNCHKSGYQGTATEIHSVLAQLEGSALNILVVTHCPALHVPSEISKFRQLVGIEIFNCSLADWPAEAAVRESTLPHVGYVYLVSTNWSVFPIGLLHDELPAHLTHIQIVDSNITELPDEIGEFWGAQDWIFVGLDTVPSLVRLPPSFCSLQIFGLYLVFTGIRELPPECLAQMELSELIISGGPLLTIPESVGSQLENLYIEKTNVTALPHWFLPAISSGTMNASLYGSPVCNSSELHEGMSSWYAVCATDHASAESFFPWEFILPLRPYN